MRAAQFTTPCTTPNSRSVMAMAPAQASALRKDPVDRSDSQRFIKRTETLVTPSAVATMHRRAEMLTRLPVGVQIIGPRMGDAALLDVAAAVAPVVDAAAG